MNMETMLVMTVIGADRPGLVESIAALVASHGGNWLDSRLSHLGGQFAGMIRVSVPAERGAQLTAALHSLERDGLSIVVQSDKAVTQAAPGRTTVLEIVAQD